MAAFEIPLSIPTGILSDSSDGPDDIRNVVDDILDIAGDTPNVVATMVPPIRDSEFSKRASVTLKISTDRASKSGPPNLKRTTSSRAERISKFDAAPALAATHIGRVHHFFSRPYTLRAPPRHRTLNGPLRSFRNETFTLCLPLCARPRALACNHHQETADPLQSPALIVENAGISVFLLSSGFPWVLAPC
jgi:hypothetical protein